MTRTQSKPKTYVGQKKVVAEHCELIEASMRSLRRRIAQYRNGPPGSDDGWTAQQIRNGKVSDLAKSITDCQTTLYRAKLALAPHIDDEVKATRALKSHGEKSRKKKRGGR